MYPTLLLILIAVAVMLFIRSRKKKDEEREPEAFREWMFSDLDAGGVLSITGVDYLVEEISRYESVDSEWREAKLLGDENEVWWLTWESDSDEEVSLTREVDFHETGILPRELEDLADEGRGEVEVGGEAYRLVEASEADYYAGDGEDGRRMYYWDFNDASGALVFGVVCWESRNYNAYQGESIPTTQVEILRPEGTDE